MYQCQNCGREFEGNFCPACGTARQEALICPNCGGNIEPQAKFCPQCGCPIADAAPASAIGARSSALSRAPLGKTILAFLPATLLLLLSLLLWAFFAAPAVKVNILIASVEENLYHLAGDDFFQKAHATAYALYGAAGCGIAAAIVALLFSGQGRKLPAVLSCLFCIVDLALGIALIAMTHGEGITVGACPILILVFSALFGLISAAAGFFNARTPLDNAILWEKTRSWFLRNLQANRKGFVLSIVFIMLFLINVAGLIEMFVRLGFENEPEACLISTLATTVFLIAGVVCYFKKPKTKSEPPKNEAKKDDSAKDDTDKPDLPQQ